MRPTRASTQSTASADPADGAGGRQRQRHRVAQAERAAAAADHVPDPADLHVPDHLEQGAENEPEDLAAEDQAEGDNHVFPGQQEQHGEPADDVEQNAPIFEWEDWDAWELDRAEREEALADLPQPGKPGSTAYIKQHLDTRIPGSTQTVREWMTHQQELAQLDGMAATAFDRRLAHHHATIQDERTRSMLP